MTDNAGNQTKTTDLTTVTVDATPPSITFDTVSFVDTGVVGEHDQHRRGVPAGLSDNVAVSQVQVFNGGSAARVCHGR